ncbi:Gfo/Idh/MocA family oxidoreductase [Akkermansiaceae bacterium]|nr:Gfo/Idh/MocA family oxidoreductase [Akkermansiaceae bacterium]MDA7933548.1 Gfo/Idh/MocA family oxidoreductase [Akkermansiaceae bacterium]MDB4423430.1 Gfo/Idh/MocA family oxidoreductase [bacterium]
MKALNTGILGCAQIAERSVIPAIQSLRREFNILGVASRDESKANASAKRFGVTPVFGYDTLLSMAGLDAVYIPLPNGLHAEWIEKALNKGIHVLVEKSLACTLEEVTRLNELAASKGLVLVENFQFRFHPQLKVIQEIVTSGRIGELRCMRSSFGFPPFPDSKNIRYDKALGGGALLDAGAYTLKVSQLLLGTDLTVTAANLNQGDDSSEVDIWGGAYLKQTDGMIFSEVAFGFDQQYQCSLELWGSKGRLTTNRVFTAPAGYVAEILIESGMDKEVVTVEPANHFEQMLKHFHELASGGAGREDEYLQNINQARLIEEVFIQAGYTS